MMNMNIDYSHTKKINRSSNAWGLVFLCLFMTVFSTVRAQEYQYELDPAHTTIGFFVEHIGFAKVFGFFREFVGSYKFDEETGEVSSVIINVETDSVFTNHRRRDAHLRSADFFNSRKFPSLIFSGEMTKVINEETFEITGDLQLLGVERPLTLVATWNKSGVYPFGDKNYVMGVSARGSFKRSDFGMNYSVENGWVGDTVEIMIEFEAIRL
ncbi:MAG: YceI family protein [Candidatus Rariloculaceae bacterium]|tara:strand:- start:285 stop:920 length:636 start_codon:yes stop_codon:yes gene_type:complete